MSTTPEQSQRPPSDNQLVAQAKLTWFHEILELDRRVCNNCFAARIPAEDSLAEHYEYFRSAGGVVTGGPEGDQQADVFCKRCGSGFGTDDLVHLEVEQPGPVTVGDDLPRQVPTHAPDDVPEDVVTPQPRLARQTAAYATPTDDEDAQWQRATNLDQQAAREARGSPGRGWSEESPMPKCGDTVSLLQCVIRAAEQLEARHDIPVDVEAAKDAAAAFKSTEQYASQDRKILARVLADHSDVDAAAIREGADSQATES